MRQSKNAVLAILFAFALGGSGVAISQADTAPVSDTAPAVVAPAPASLPGVVPAFPGPLVRPNRHRCRTRRCRYLAWISHHRWLRPAAHLDGASEYGNEDGFLHGPLGCEKYGRYEPGDMGVAHKTLPCGTELRMCYPAVSAHHFAIPHHRCVKVTVIDRGPYVAGREFDIQVAPAAKLHFSGLGAVEWEVLHSHHSHGRH